MNFWQHRISHEKEVSYTLLDKGYLTIGWVDFLTHDLLNDTNMCDRECYRKYYDHFYSHKPTIAHNLWYFLNILPGDFVMVPLDNNMCAVVKAEARPDYITALPFKEFTTVEGTKCFIKNDGIYNGENGRKYDLGFLCKCKLLKKLSRDELPEALRKKMHVQSTIITLNPVANDVLELIKE